MAHFAKLENNKVTEIQIVNNKILLDKDGKEDEALGIAYLKGLFGSHTTWVQSSYNGKLRKQYAGVGDTYDATNDVFIVQQPFASWTLDSNFNWQPPKEQPASDDGKKYKWDEDKKSWEEWE
tara:strand:+ start:1288 stop:1653 length:366 start_codon:yes stop_codon:yes gene_type:complete